MTPGPRQRAGGRPGRVTSPSAGPSWRDATREITVAVLLVLAITVGAWVLAGPAAAGFAALTCAALSLVALRSLVQPHEPPAVPHLSAELGPSRSFLGFWRTRSDLVDATRSLSAWDSGLRPRLTNLLAARLSERHGISLAEDPEAARRVLNAGRTGRTGRAGRTDLWTWIDPQRQTPLNAGAVAGIPPQVLAALIDRLERL
jgi:hypothetical protein